MPMGGLIRFSDGRSSLLRPVNDAEWIEQWLRRSVQPQTLWSLTTPLLPIGEGLPTPLGTVVPIVGIDADGNTVVVLFDLRVEQPMESVLGQSLSVLHWSQGLDERQLEAFARYFWHDANASLRGVWERVQGVHDRPVTFGQQAKVHVLSRRSLSVLVEVQTFLQRQGLAVLFFRLHTLQGEQGEVVAFAELIMTPPTAPLSAQAAPSVQRVGEAEAFLRNLQGQVR